MAESKKSSATTADVEAQIKEIRSDIEKLTELLGELAGSHLDATKASAKDEVDHLLKRSRELGDKAQGKARETTESVESYIKEKPIQSALIALVVGVLFGALSRR